MRVRFEGVSKRFGAHQALRDLTLKVEPGECLVLLGPSGCGKTTLLRLLAGLETPDTGRILIGDRVVNDVPPPERDVAMVFQRGTRALTAICQRSTLERSPQVCRADG